jgi:glycosyltransferase involved in cell wall biosynthesis
LVSYSEVQPHLMIVIHSLRGGGAERVAVDLGAYWIQRGYMVTVATQMDASSDSYPLYEGVTRYVLGTAGNSRGKFSGLLANARRVWRLRRLIKREQPTIVLGMMTTSSVLAVSAARGLPCRVIASEHTHPPSQSLSSVWQRWRRWAYPKAQAVVALTSGTAAWLEENVPGSEIAIIPNSVAWPLRQAEPVVPAPEKQGRKRLLAVGRLHPVKGFDVLIRAFAMLAWHYDEWDLVILGEGDERDALEQQVSEAGLQTRISLPGRVGNIADWYRSSDLYVLSSVTEGLSNTLLESMACGLPVVAFDCDTGPREIVRPGIDGILVRPVQDAEALAAHLSDMMAHPDRRLAYGRRAIDVRDRFSTTRVMALWGQLFEK